MRSALAALVGLAMALWAGLVGGPAAGADPAAIERGLDLVGPPSPPCAAIAYGWPPLPAFGD